MSAPGGRDGASLLEATVAAALAGVLLAGLAVLLADLGRLAGLRDATAAAAETGRVAAHVIGAEAGHLVPGDLVAAGDSLVLRAVRGVGIVCAAEASGGIVRWSGMRDPAPARDSLLVLGAHGEQSLPLLDAARAEVTCDSTAPAWSLSGGQPLPAGSVVLVFERGHYFLSGRALRFRAGAAGRQPLTEENVERGAGFALRAAVGRLDVSLPIGALPAAALPLADSGGFALTLQRPDSLP
mgnify:CR=1 FL=1